MTDAPKEETMSKSKALPKKLFAKWMIDSHDAPWIEPAQDIEELAEKGETVYIGEYKLVKVHKVNLSLKIA